jgi:hypothetical protein
MFLHTVCWFVGPSFVRYVANLKVYAGEAAPCLAVGNHDNGLQKAKSVGSIRNSNCNNFTRTGFVRLNVTILGQIKH